MTIHRPHQSISRALSIAAEMEALAQALVAKQEAVVVPVVAAYLPAKGQKRFNNKARSAYIVACSELNLAVVLASPLALTTTDRRMPTQDNEPPNHPPPNY